MNTEWVIRIVLFGIVHWVLAGIMIHDLAYRQEVFGKRKPLWTIVILFIPCFGSLLYLLFHPQILNPPRSRDEQQRRNRNR